MARLPLLKPRLTTLNGRSVQLPPKTADQHYLSYDHQRWAKYVIARADFRCEKCGRDNCRLFADHIMELRDGGKPYDVMNGQALCGSCHTLKTMRSRRERTSTIN